MDVFWCETLDHKRLTTICYGSTFCWDAVYATLVVILLWSLSSSCTQMHIVSNCILLCCLRLLVMWMWMCVCMHMFSGCQAVLQKSRFILAQDSQESCPVVFALISRRLCCQCYVAATIIKVQVIYIICMNEVAGGWNSGATVQWKGGGSTMSGNRGLLYGPMDVFQVAGV